LKNIVVFPSLIAPVSAASCFGGAEMAALALAEALAARGHRVAIVGLPGTHARGAATWLVERGTPILRPGGEPPLAVPRPHTRAHDGFTGAAARSPSDPSTAALDTLPPAAPSGRSAPWTALGAGDPEAAQRADVFAPLMADIEARAIAGTIDVLHLHLIDPRALELADQLARRCPRLVVVATLHLAAEFPATNDVVGRLLASQTPIRFTTPSHASKRSYLRLVASHHGDTDVRDPISASEASGGAQSSALALRVVPNGIDVDRILPALEPAPGRKLLWAGRRSREKGLEAALAIARRLDRRIIVAGAHAPEYGARIDTSHPLVEDLGLLPRAEMVRIFARAEATLVTSSIAEASSLVAMESLASGTPVVAFRVGALEEIIEEGVTGFLVPPGDVVAAARALQRIPQISRARCRSEAVERFDHRRTLDAFEALYCRDPRPNVSLPCPSNLVS
jgi:glycosyltransferase involved in cell wall biosynthesis